jgi:uncharacterized protein (TIGR03435 family)
MISMNEILAILTAIINSLWQAAAVAAIVWVALRFWPRTNAATRYAIWWATLAVVLILPAAPRFIASIRHHKVTTNAKPAASAPAVTPAPNRVELFVIPAAPRRAARWPIAVLAIWAAILFWRLHQIGRSYLYLRSVKRRAVVSPIPLPDIPRRADLLISQDIASPMALGFLKPAVVLPDSLLAELSDAEREHVLLHEAAHLVRRDDWTNLATRFLAGALALHPVAIWILWRIDREREIACDEWVVSRTGAARPYAKSLARLYDLLHGRGTQMLASGIFGRSSRLGDRIETVLGTGRIFSSRTSAAGVIAGALALTGLMLGESVAPPLIAFAQQASRPEFEVVSIKPADPSAVARSGQTTPAGVRAKNLRLFELILGAYHLNREQLIGGPNWIETAGWDIDARFPAGAGPAQQNQMMQNMLADRFHLAMHRETRELPVYVLTVTKGGAKLRPGDAEGGMAAGPRQIRYRSANMVELAGQLSSYLGRQVIDETHLAGQFAIDLSFAPVDPAVSPDDAARESSPSIFQALQEQAGLKLESARRPVEVLIIDHAEKPDAN